MENSKENEFQTLMLFLFSKNMLGSEITNFISEIIENGSLEIDGKRITVDIFGKCSIRESKLEKLYYGRCCLMWG